MILPIKDINVSNRIRTHFDEKKQDKLAESMRIVGLIQPVVIDEDKNLLAGERRIRAAKLLGWTDIKTVYLNDLDPWQKKVVELEENLRREDLTYVEEGLALERIHELFQQKHGKTAELGGRKGGWKIKDTAEHLGMSAGAVSQDLQLTRAIKQDPELAQQKTKIAARSMMQRKQTIKARQLLAVLSKAKKPKKETAYLERVEQETELIHGNALHFIPTLPNDSVDCLVTDPPWQVEFDQKFGSDPQTGLDITKKVLSLLYPKLKSGSLCWMFCATKHLIKGTILDLVVSCGYRVFEQILIWYKPHVAHSSHPYRELKNDYEPALFFSKDSPRDLVKPMFAVQSETIPGVKLHPAQKPLNLLQDLILNSTVEGELVIDPFMGSGKVCEAAKNTKRRSIGIELTEESYNIAVGNIGG